MVGSQTYINEVVVVQSDIHILNQWTKIFKQPNGLYNRRAHGNIQNHNLFRCLWAMNVGRRYLACNLKNTSSGNRTTDSSLYWRSSTVGMTQLRLGEKKKQSSGET